jgi:hypothetical protein
MPVFRSFFAQVEEDKFAARVVSRSSGRAEHFCLGANVLKSTKNRHEPIPVTDDEAGHHFVQPLSGTGWDSLRGRHVSRDSFCSNAAAHLLVQILSLSGQRAIGLTGGCVVLCWCVFPGRILLRCVGRMARRFESIHWKCGSGQAVLEFGRTSDHHQGQAREVGRRFKLPSMAV